MTREPASNPNVRCGTKDRALRGDHPPRPWPVARGRRALRVNQVLRQPMFVLRQPVLPGQGVATGTSPSSPMARDLWQVVVSVGCGSWWGRRRLSGPPGLREKWNDALPLAVHGPAVMDEFGNYGSKEEMEAAFAAVGAFNDKLQADGCWVFAGGLQAASTGDRRRRRG